MVRVALRRDEPEPEHLEAEVLAHLLEQRDVAAAPVPEVEVGADHDDPGPQQPDEHLAHELLGGLVAALLVEAQHAHDVEQRERFEQLELLVERGQQLRRGLRPHDLGRMPVERDERGVEAAGVGELAHELQHLRVAEVHAVVRADRHDAAVAQRREARRPGARPGWSVTATIRRRVTSRSPSAGSAGRPHGLSAGAPPLVDREQRPALVDDRVRPGPVDRERRRSGTPSRGRPPAPTPRRPSPARAPRIASTGVSSAAAGSASIASSGWASSIVNEPTRSRRSAARCAGPPSAAPRSAASERM